MISDVEECNIPLDARLSKDMIAIVLSAARRVSEDSRDTF
jgi:hypothetical protein